jgi:GDP-L-fucose synthase
MATQRSPLDCNSSIYIAGHRGMVGSAMVRHLHAHGYDKLIIRTSTELDLTDQAAVKQFFSKHNIDYVVLAAARVGGIHANNTYPASFIYQNLMIQTNVIHQAYEAGIKDLLFLGSSCIYPKFCSQPMREEYLLSGILEPTNEPYAVAKIGGIKMCESYNRQYKTRYRAVMPTNLYGPGDNYHLQNSHVIPAIIRKCHLAKLSAAGKTDQIERDERIFGIIPDDIKKSLALPQAKGMALTDVKSEANEPYVKLWGSGSARREFLHADDMAAACFIVMSMSQSRYEQSLAMQAESTELAQPSFLNIGAGKDCTIREVAEMIQEVVGFAGELRFDPGQPDGTPQKLLDTSRINGLGWQPRFSLQEGLADTYRWYCSRTSI